MPLTPNAQPTSILNRKIKVKTTFDGSGISEPHRVIGPIAQNLNTTILAGGNKIVIPLTESLGQGGHYLKIHMPTQYGGALDSTMFITFCKKNSNYVDGYQDYLSNLPTAYINSLKLWVDNGQTPNTTGTARTRNLTFSAYGRETNQVENSRMFKVAFAYIGVTDTEEDNDTEDTVALGFDSTTLNTGGDGGTQQSAPNAG